LRRILCLLLALFYCLPIAAAEKYSEFPEALRITNERVKTPVSDTSYKMFYYPVTCHDEVNAQLKERINQLAEKVAPVLPRKSAIKNESAMLDAGASIYRTGTSWASFLMLATVLDDQQQLAMAYDAWAYDLSTGSRLTLSDVLTESQAMWETLREETYRQLSAYYPQLMTGGSKISALCSPEYLLTVPFTLSPAFLQFHFPANALYEGREMIMHVRIPYTLLAPYLTEAAKQQTDNSRYKLAALTFDDGPTRRRTLNVIRNLRNGCISATFFIVGDRIANAPDLIALEHNAGHSIGSHNYHHVYPAEMRGKVQLYRDMLNAELIEITGQRVSLMRAPGGLEQIYIDENVGIPLIHWSLSSHDSSGESLEPSTEARYLAYGVGDGGIILMHDLQASTSEYTYYMAAMLNNRGYMCVTVEELFALRGIPLQPDTVYVKAPPAEQ